MMDHALSQTGQYNIAIGWRANHELTTECGTVCIGHEASTPKGKGYWITIKGLFDGPVTEDMRPEYNAWHKRVSDTRGDGTGSLEPWFAAVAEIADILPPEVTREKVRNVIHASYVSTVGLEGC